VTSVRERDDIRGGNDWLRLLLITLAWLALARALALYGAPYLPRALAAALTLQSWLSIVLVVSTAAGLALAFKLLARPRADLGLERQRPADVAAATLAAPAVVVTSAWLGFQLALPTLLAEIAQGGRDAAQRNTGEFGRAIVQTHVLTTLLWAVVLTPIAEELLFRGALWSAVARPFRGSAAAAAGATVVTGAIFAWLHHDQPGGAGIVRVTQAACLGLALGFVRHATGGIAAGIGLHALFNLMTIAKARRWFESPGWPPPLPIATLYWQIAAATTPLVLLYVLHRQSRLAGLDAVVSVHLRTAPASPLDPRSLAADRDRALAPAWRRLARLEPGTVTTEPEGDGVTVTWITPVALRTPLLAAVRPLARAAVTAALRSVLFAARARLERD
jgi:membrane protease YdiL (CAAX protease family)